MKKLFNASNLHVGGGVQVAASIMAELASMDGEVMDFDVVMSSEVAEGSRRNWPFDCRIIDIYGLRPRSGNFRQRLGDYDSVFTIFGPLYEWRTPFRSIVGFAQPWIIYPENECYAMLPPVRRLLTRLKFRIQAMFFQRADALVVELDHVKRGLIRELGIEADRIHVIPNCLSAIYSNQRLWEPLEVPSVKCDLKLGFIGRNYSHKNTQVFPQIAKALAEAHGINARFYVTFTEKEWRACAPEFRAACINVGPLSPSQCPNFYRSMDAIVFPSLLECFSATPLEAMAMERPLFVSDRPFNRDVCGEHAQYFDPMAPITAAEQIARMVHGGGYAPEVLQRARERAMSFANPAQRARKYLGLLRGEARTE